jgi:ABC-type branched-subunit amino acid transport system substrate-binding protein
VTVAFALALLTGCGGDDAGGPAEPVNADTLVVYSSLPRSGGSAALGDAVAAGQRLALSDADGRAGQYRIELVELDSAEPDERDWDPDRVAENAGRAADDPAAIAYLGELELGASAVSLPVTNEESILQVSPTDGLTSLTLPQSGPGNDPERFYPDRKSVV